MDQTIDTRFFYLFITDLLAHKLSVRSFKLYLSFGVQHFGL